MEKKKSLALTVGWSPNCPVCSKSL